MQFFIASDHAGFTLKGSVLGILEQMGHRVIDLGPMDAERVDYPDFANILP